MYAEVTIEAGETYGTSLSVYSSVNSLGQMPGVVIGSVMMVWFGHLPYFIISMLLFITTCVAITRSKFKILQLENIKSEKHKRCINQGHPITLKRKKRKKN